MSLRVVHIDDVPLVERPNIRGGTLLSRCLLTGEPGTPWNFALQLSSTPTYYSPRHRHNFDQIRYQLSGDFDFSADGMMKPGTIAYFPEGTYYGPQQCESGSETLVLQFGGASRSGYLCAEDHERASAELASRGTFAKGVYTQIRPDGSKLNKDAYEAVWEHVNGRPLVYPGERYLRPVFMEPGSFNWVAVDGQPGVCAKSLGEFSELRTRLAVYRLAPGASLSLADHSIYFVTSGSGCAGNQPFERYSTIDAPAGQRGSLTCGAGEPVELLHIGLPRFS